MLKQFLEAGKVVGMHGVRGEMRFDVWCDGADFLKKIKTLYLDADGNRAVGVVSVRPHKNAALLKLDGVLTIEEAEKYRGRVSVTVDETDDRGVTVYHLHVAENDMGRVIGKQGRIAKAIRTVVKARATKDGTRVQVEID